MARGVRDAKLETRAQRLKLVPGARHFRSIGKGVALCYRRTKDGFGVWAVRIAQENGKYALRSLGTADDHQDADGTNVLSFYQAQEAARKVAAEPITEAARSAEGFTVQEAANQYLAWYRLNRKATRATELVIEAHILPAFGVRPMTSLTTTAIRKWHAALAEKPARLRTAPGAKKPNVRAAPLTNDAKRARKATANRILTVLKAMLSRAVQDEDNHLPTSLAETWRAVKPFEKADEPRIRFLTDSEALRLANACPPDLRSLVRGALLTGARFGELAGLQVKDVNLDTCQVYVAESKSGRSRFIPLNKEGVALFTQITVGRNGSDLVFRKKDGTPWGKNHHVRALLVACKAAKVTPAVRFHELRHTFASHLAQAGVPLLTIATLLGHADTRITARHYAHLADRTLADAVAKLPSFGADESKVIPVSRRRRRTT